MKKMKKLFAVLLTLAMVLGMSMTSFAAETSYTSEIKVTGLSSQEDETVNLYAAITLNADKNEWVIAEWAKPYIRLNKDKKKYEITDEKKLSEVVSGTPIQQTHSAGHTEVTFDAVPVGAYVVTASGNKIAYAPMVAETYNADETYMQAKNVQLVAKSTGYIVDKSADDNFVARGQEVTFTITTTFPSFDVADSADNHFTIIDTPTGLDITDVTNITIGGAKTEDYTISEANDGKYTIDLTKAIGTSNANAGKTVVVTYKAIVTADDGYSNTANAYRNNADMGHGDEKGYTGNIVLTKYAENGKTVLEGAEFKLYKATKDKVKEENSGVSALRFIKLGDGIYKLALADNEATSTDTLVAVNGTLTVKGLDEGTYWFEETKAPEGYSINVDGASATIKESKDKNVTVPTSLKDTKLSALPSTGGIGTTIFTIAGCLIMIAAAGLFFASRKKTNK